MAPRLSGFTTRIHHWPVLFWQVVQRSIVGEAQFHKVWVDLSSCLTGASPDQLADLLWALAILQYPRDESATHPLLAKIVVEISRNTAGRGTTVVARHVSIMVWALAKLRAKLVIFHECHPGRNVAT